MSLYDTRLYKWFMRRLGRQVKCSDCPHWRFQRETFLNLPSFEGRQIHRVGLCALDEPRLFNMNELGMAFRAWFADDWCPRHPLHVATPLAEPSLWGLPSDVSYAPGQPGHDAAGFNRAPTLDEALRLAQGAHARRGGGMKYQFIMEPSYVSKPRDTPVINDNEPSNG